MFEKFGEFDSFEELNRAAAAQKAEGDEDSLVALALENGIDKEDAEDYMDGYCEELATPLMAAAGKLKIEKEEYKLTGMLAEFAEEVLAMCAEQEAMARAVRKKGMTIAEYIARLISGGYEHRAVVDKKIIEKCSKEIKNIIGGHEFSIGIPDRKHRKEIARAYYLNCTGATVKEADDDSI